MKRSHIAVIFFFALFATASLLRAQASTRSPIAAYRTAERMRFEACEPPRVYAAADTPTKFYFAFRDTIHGHADRIFTTTPLWQIDEDTTGAHADTRVLWGNQSATEWRDDSTRWFDIALALQVGRTNAADTEHVADVRVVWFKSDLQTYDTLRAFGIPWCRFPLPFTQYVFFDTATFHFDRPFLRGCDSLLVEVRSRRVVTTRLSWVTVEDNLAHDLRAGADLYYYDTHDTPQHTSLRTRMMLVDSLLWNEEDALNAAGQSALAMPIVSLPASERSCATHVDAALRYHEMILQRANRNADK